jgi:rhodanese-related sulfurtransferase
MTRAAALLLLLALALAACGDDSEQAPTAVRTVAAAEVGPDVAAGRTLLVDVREADEWDAGRAPRAIHVPLAEVERRLGEIERAAAGRPIVFICRSGRRSAQAARIAAAGGLEPVSSVDGGMEAWVDAGLPLRPRDGTVL